MKGDIKTLDDIKILVDNFYGNVRKDELLAKVFNDRIQDRWPQHVEKMYRFWQTVLLDEHTYYGSPFVPHADLPVQGAHFEQWISLFYATVDEFFEGENANKAKWQGQKMAEMFQYKIEYYRDKSSTPLV